MAIDSSKLIQFYAGTALPATTVDNHVYFIHNEGKGKLYKGSVLIGETNDTAAIESINQQITDINTALDKKASKDDLNEHVKLYQTLVETVTGLGTRLTTAEGKIKTIEDDYLKAADKTALQGNIDALAGKVGTVPENKTVMGIIGEIQENAYDDTELREEFQGKLDLKADKTQVATDIETAVNAEVSAREAAVAGVQGEVDALEQTHATDKAALEAAIALKADQTALDQVNQTLTGVKEDVDFFFNGALGDDPENVAKVKNTLKEIQDYIDSDVEGASGMAASIQQNADDIDALEKADEAQDAKIKALEDKFGEGEGSVSDQIADAVATEKAAREEAIEAVTEKAQQGIDDAASALAAAQEADRKAVAAQGEVDALEGVVAGKAAQADLEALEGRVETAEGEIDTLQGEMDTVEGKVATLESDLNTAETGLKARMTVAEGDISALYNALIWHSTVA